MSGFGPQGDQGEVWDAKLRQAQAGGGGHQCYQLVVGSFFGSPACFPGTWLGSWSHLPFFLCTPLLRSWNDDLRFCIWAPRWRRPNPRACLNTKSKAHLMYPSLRSELHPCLGEVDRRIQLSKHTLQAPHILKTETHNINPRSQTTIYIFYSLTKTLKNSEEAR